MRTKALLCLAAVAAIAIPASAQVYSANVVGYVNLTMKPGYNLVANQLTTGTNGLNQVLPGAQTEALVLKYANNSYGQDIFDGAAWLDAASGNPTTTQVKPGEGFFYFNPQTTDKVITLVGEVVQGQSTVALPAGYALVASVVPQAVDLTAANGFPQQLEALYLTYDNPGKTYNQLINDGTQWLDSGSGNPMQATPAVGQGFFYFNPTQTATSWVRTFNVQ